MNLGTRWLRGAALMLSVACASHCSRGERAAPRASASVLEVAADVPAPAELAGELVVARPGELWKQLRALAGEGALLPANFELLVATLLELPAPAASSIDATRPLVGALLLPQNAAPRWVLAMRVESGAELVARVAMGADAVFTSSSSPTPGLTLLRHKKPVGGVTIGVLGNHLLVASEGAALELAAPYVVRTLARRPPPSEPLVLEFGQSALAGPLTAMLAHKWQTYQQELRALDRAQRDAKGRQPDFADPASLITTADQSVRALFDLLQTMSKARLVVSPGDTSVRAQLELEPASGRFAEEAIAELAVGDLEPLLALPADTAVALLLRSTPEERTESAKQAGLGLEQLFGARLSEKDREKLRRALASFHDGRGGTAIYGLLPGRTLFLHTDVRDAGKLDAGAQSIARALEVPAIRAPLRELFGDFKLRASSREVSGTRARSFVFQSSGAQAGARAPALEALFVAGEKEAVLTLGAAPEPALLSLLGKNTGTLGSEPAVSALLAPAREGVAMALYADAARLGLTDAKVTRAPAFVALTRAERVARVELLCSAAAASVMLTHWGTR